MFNVSTVYMILTRPFSCLFELHLVLSYSMVLMLIQTTCLATISYIISYHIISYHIISYHISCRVVSCRVVPCHAMSCHVISYHITSLHISSSVCFTR